MWFELTKIALPSIVALFAAFFAAHRTNAYAEKRWDKQIAHDKEVNKTKEKKLNIERIYKDLAQRDREVRFLYRARKAYLLNEITKEQLYEDIKDTVDVRRVNEARVLIELYFPMLSNDINKIDSSLHEMQMCFVSGDVPILEKRKYWANIIDLAQDEYNKKMDVLLNKLQTEIRE